MTDRTVAWDYPLFGIRLIIRTFHGQANTMLLFLNESGATSKERSPCLLKLLALLPLCCHVRSHVRVRNGDREMNEITVCENIVKRKKICTLLQN